jgi:branched-subunit amino acid transport protein
MDRSEMNIRPEFLGLVLACALVTAVPRVLPLLVLSRLQLPQWLLDWLRYVPVAVLASLLSLELLNTGTAGLVGIAAALVVAAATRSLLGTVLAGVAVYWLCGNTLFL